MKPYGQHIVDNILSQLGNWSNLSEDSKLMVPFHVLGSEKERLLDQVTTIEMAKSDSHTTPPYIARTWKRYSFEAVDGTEFNNGIEIVGDSIRLRPVDNLLNFSAGPPTGYLNDSTNWVEGIDLSALSGKTVIDIQYVHGLKTSLDELTQEAVVFLIAETASAVPYYAIYYADSTTRVMTLKEYRQSYETTGSDERVVPEEDFTYTLDFPVSDLDDQIQLLDLVRSTVTDKLYRPVHHITDAMSLTPGALTGTLVVGTPTPISITTSEFTHAHWFIPGSGKAESGWMWVDTDSVLHVKHANVQDSDDTAIELTTPLFPVTDTFRVVVKFEDLMLKLYVNGVLRDSESGTIVGTVSLSPLQQWGGSNGKVGPTEYWIKAWTDSEISFDYDYPSISPVYAPASLLTEDLCIHKYNMIEGSGTILYDVATSSYTSRINADLSDYSTMTWSTSSTFPAITKYDFVRNGYGVIASSPTNILGLLKETFTIEMAIELATGGTVLELYNGADDYILISVATSGTSVVVVDRRDGTSTTSTAAGLTASNLLFIRYRSDGADQYLDVDGVEEDTDANVEVFGESDAKVYLGDDNASGTPLNVEAIVHFIAIAPGVEYTATIVETVSKRPPGIFQHQWFNDIHDDKLYNSGIFNNHLDVSLLTTELRNPALQQTDGTFKSIVNSQPAELFHKPYLIGTDLFPVLPGTTWAAEYNYKTIEVPSGFNSGIEFHGTRQPGATDFKDITAVYDAPAGGEVTVVPTQASPGRIEIVDQRALNGMSVDILFEGVKLNTQAWGDSSVIFSYTISDAELYELKPSMVVVKTAAGIKQTVSVYVSGNSVYIDAVDNGALTVYIKYTARKTVAKTVRRSEGANAVTSLAASDYSSFTTKRRLSIISTILTNASTYSAVTPGNTKYFIDDSLASAYVRLMSFESDTKYLIEISHDFQNGILYKALSLLNSNEKPRWIRHFHHHWAILTDQGNIYCIDAHDLSVHWNYNLIVSTTTSYLPKQFFFDSENNLFVMYSDGTDFELKSFAPDYDYCMVFNEVDQDSPSVIRVVIFTRKQYTEVQLRTDMPDLPPNLNGYEIY